MTETTGTQPAMRRERLGELLAGRGKLVADYLSAVTGSAGRLIFALVYFVVLANTLTIAEFGVFATASAAGVMLSRLLAFGFVSPLYRAATTRPALIGTFTAGFMLLGALSVPMIAVAGWGVHAVFFGTTLTPVLFFSVVAAEALLWRPAEVVVIVNNGIGRFGRGAIIVILGTAIRTAAALAFMFGPDHDLATWCGYYLVANAASLAIAATCFYPRQRLRLRPRVYVGRLADSAYVALAEVLFYLQMEFDKLLVLAFGGPHLAGIYAIIMRLVDLTAIPVRTFTMMLVQHIMRIPAAIERGVVRGGIEVGVFLVSTAGLLAFVAFLSQFPTALGANVAEAAPLLALAIFVPGIRNLIEYQAELLFARGQTLIRVINLALLAAAKAVVLTWLLVLATDTPTFIWSLNAGFAILYLASFLLTYSAMRMPARRF
ncbi:MAG: lipopolysaccharide biosynthesis protein [Rhizobiaceae bacterium]